MHMILNFYQHFILLFFVFHYSLFEGLVHQSTKTLIGKND